MAQTQINRNCQQCLHAYMYMFPVIGIQVGHSDMTWWFRVHVLSLAFLVVVVVVAVVAVAVVVYLFA